MNNLKLEAGQAYEVQIIWQRFTKTLYVKSIIKITKQSFFWKNKIIDWITYSEFEDLTYEEIMTLEDFNKIALYKKIK